jgi:hypothetical protein
MGPPSWLGLFWLGAIVIVALQSALGLIVLATGAAPRDPTHVIYGIVVTGLLLGAPTLTTTLRNHTRMRVLAVSATVAAAVAIRLLQTG